MIPTMAPLLAPPGPTSALRLAYILSASHSGSTLLALLLGTHPAVATVGELKATSLGDVERYLCSCHRRLGDCSFWGAIAADMTAANIPFEVGRTPTDYLATSSRYARALLRPLHRGLILEFARDLALAFSTTWRRHLAHTQVLNAALVRAISARTAKPLLVDSSKTGLRLKYLLRNKAFDVRVIYLVRDGRGVTLAHLDPRRFADAATPEHQSGGTGGPPSIPPLSIREGAQLWRRSNEEALTILQQMDPARWVRIRYETLCEEPERTLENLLRFLGVEPIVGKLDFRRQHHHVIGNGMRLDRGSDIRLDERWRSVLTSADLRTFDATAGSLNQSLGYF